MDDLYIGVLIIGILSFMLFQLALYLWDRTSPLMIDVLAVTTVVGTILYAFLLRDNQVLARILPFSNMVVLSNWFPLSASFLAGIAFNRVPGWNWRKAVSTWALLGIGIFSAMLPITGVAPLCKNKWRDGVCLQTSQRTCSPASATTMLSQYGVQTTEQQMAELCLTRDSGTAWQGLYHGLSVQLKKVGRRVEIFDCTIDELRSFPEYPVLLSVELKESDAGKYLIYVQELGWEPDTPHTVVLLGFDSAGNALIGEPAFGIEQWRPRDLEILWHGRGMRPVPEG